MNDLIGKTIKEAEVDGFGIRIVFTNGAVFEYSASDGGYSQYELTEATADAQTERKKEEIDRIESAIRHIQTAADVDPWATEIAVEAMRKQIADFGKMPEQTAETAQKEACPVCGYKFQDCQCRFSGSAHPDRSKRAIVVADHIYLLTDAQIAHLAKVQEWWQISYDDEEMDRILEELKGNEKD